MRGSMQKVRQVGEKMRLSCFMELITAPPLLLYLSIGFWDMGTGMFFPFAVLLFLMVAFRFVRSYPSTCSGPMAQILGRCAFAYAFRFAFGFYPIRFVVSPACVPHALTARRKKRRVYHSSTMIIFNLLVFGLLIYINSIIRY